MRTLIVLSYVIVVCLAFPPDSWRKADVLRRAFETMKRSGTIEDEFNEIDTDGDGGISNDEYVKYTSYLDDVFPEDERRFYFSMALIRFDYNRDKLMDLKDYTLWKESGWSRT